MRAEKIVYGLKYGMQTFLLGKKLPLLFALVITDTCNLDCFYCKGKNRGKIHFSSAQAFNAIKSAYARGHRSLYFTGGEPMLWESDGYNLKNLIDFSIKIGFFEVFVFTNGTVPLDISSCHYIVTIDGPREIHNRIRTNTFDLIIENVENAATKNVFATMTLTKANVDYLEDYVNSLTELNLFKGLSFNLLTAEHKALKEYGLLGEERQEDLKMIWSLRNLGYPISISRAAYHALLHNNWKRPIQQIELATPDALFTCCRQGVDPNVCANCGYFGCVEISQVLSLKPSAIKRVIKMIS